MKTIDEVFKMYFGSAKEYPDAAYLIKEAMRAYAKEAIDRCAEKARTKTNHESTSVIVDKDSILDVKNELK